MKTKRTKRIKQEVELYSGPIAGLQYYDANLSVLKRGQVLQLFHEPNNPADPNAIRIEANGTKLGHIPRIETHKLHTARRMGQKVTAKIRNIWPNNPSWSAVHIIVTADANVEPADIPFG